LTPLLPCHCAAFTCGYVRSVPESCPLFAQDGRFVSRKTVAY
jgi:hypothetical protein